MNKTILIAALALAGCGSPDITGTTMRQAPALVADSARPVQATTKCLSAELVRRWGKWHPMRGFSLGGNQRITEWDDGKRITLENGMILIDIMPKGDASNVTWRDNSGSLGHWTRPDAIEMTAQCGKADGT